jgi:hypothetical protein
METFKKTIKQRVIISRIYLVCLMLITMVPRIFFDEYAALADTHAFAFSIGAMVGVGGLVIVLLWKYGRALKNEDYLRKLYIKETDERNVLIRTKTGGSAVMIIIAGLIVGIIGSTFFSKTVFYTLIAVFVFIALVHLVLKIYYNKKM